MRNDARRRRRSGPGRRTRAPDGSVVFAHDSSLRDVLKFHPHPRAEVAVWYKDGDGARDGDGDGRRRSGDGDSVLEGFFGSNITLCYQVSGYNGASISQIDGTSIG